MAMPKIKSAVLACALFAASSGAAAQQMVRADSVAAGAVWAQKLAVSETIYYCEGYVAAAVKEQLAVVLEGWYNANGKYLDITDIIRREMVKSVTAASGETAAIDFVMSMGEQDKAARADIRATLDQNPADQREGKCYGMIVAINEGQFDIATALPEDAQHLDARAPVMGW